MLKLSQLRQSLSCDKLRDWEESKREPELALKSIMDPLIVFKLQTY